MKNELLGKKKVQSDPDWIWWQKMCDVLAPQAETTNDTVMNVDSPAKAVRATRSEVVGTESLEEPAVTEAAPASARNKRRTVVAAAYVPPAKVARRRTIHPAAVKEASPPPSPAILTYTINDLPATNVKVTLAPQTPEPAVKHVSSPWNKKPQSSPAGTPRSAKSSTPSKTPNKNQLPENASTTNTPNRSYSDVRPKVNITVGNNSMQVDDDESSLSQSVHDECFSTAMFVESRLRTYDDAKRQRIIFKIHELFYQEDVE